MKLSDFICEYKRAVTADIEPLTTMVMRNLMPPVLRAAHRDAFLALEAFITKQEK